MPELSCTARRVGDYESRTEEYEVRYQAARAYEINAALDAAVETARAVISEADPDTKGPTDEALSQLAWRTIQSAKYQEGEATTSRLRL